MSSKFPIEWSPVINAYLAEEIKLGKAAELLDLHELELRQLFRKWGIAVRIGPGNLAEAQAEVETINTWFSDQHPAKYTK